MKKIDKSLSNYRIKLAVLCFLFIFAPACMISQSKENTKVEKTDEKTETVKKKKTTKDKPKVEKTSSSGANDDLKKKVCKKYDSCGCQDYDECMAEVENLNYADEVWECMLKSSCESLCAGDPDGCKKSGDNPKTTAPDVPNCSQTSCTKNGDCPGGCHGGCIHGYCSLF